MRVGDMVYPDFDRKTRWSDFWTNTRYITEFGRRPRIVTCVIPVLPSGRYLQVEGMKINFPESDMKRMSQEEVDDMLHRYRGETAASKFNV